MSKEDSTKNLEELISKVSKELEELKKSNLDSLPVSRAIGIRERMLKKLKSMLSKARVEILLTKIRS